MNSAVTHYIERTRGWNPSEYRIESRGLSADGQHDLFLILYLNDEHSSHPGAGLSIELYVRRASQLVEKEVGGQ
jgi:hypothetical protein